MSEYEEALSVLRRMEQNQAKSIEMQAEHLALVKTQLERADAKAQESIALQRAANLRQARALNIALPIILLALLYVGYLLFTHT